MSRTQQTRGRHTRTCAFVLVLVSSVANCPRHAVAHASECSFATDSLWIVHPLNESVVFTTDSSPASMFLRIKQPLVAKSVIVFEVNGSPWMELTPRGHHLNAPLPRSVQGSVMISARLRQDSDDGTDAWDEERVCVWVEIRPKLMQVNGGVEADSSSCYHDRSIERACCDRAILSAATPGSV